MSDNFRARVFLGDAFQLVKDLDLESVSAIITDPPYFLDGMGVNWNEDMTGRKQTKKQTVTSLKAGMKFDPKQGQEFQRFMGELAKESLPFMKPGGWFISFSAPRLYHRLAVGVEDAGWEVRDMWEWLYTQNQMKAMSVERQLNNDSALSEEEKNGMRDTLQSWKTPQVKSCFEPILLAQKPREGTFYNNWKKHHIGLINVKSNVGTKENMDTSNVMSTEEISESIDKAFLVGKPTKKEKGETTHLSVKPLALMDHLITISVPKNGLVVDPFNGSGTTGISTVRTSRKFIGFEQNEEYWRQSAVRMAESGFQTIFHDGYYEVI